MADPKLRDAPRADERGRGRAHRAVDIIQELLWRQFACAGCTKKVLLRARSKSRSLAREHTPCGDKQPRSPFGALVAAAIFVQTNR
jgi:hypothetical protein